MASSMASLGAEAHAWTVADDEDGLRIDHFVAARAGLSHAAARRALAAIDDGALRLNGRPAKRGQRLRAGDRVALVGALPDAAALRPQPQPELPLAVVHLDADVIAVAKPAGLPTHPLRPGERDTLAGALLARHPECADVGDDPREAGFVHRLDVDTSGVLLAARTRPAWLALRAAFHQGRAAKDYLALVAGALPADEGELRHALAHDPRDRRRMRIAADDEPGALAARSHYRRLGSASGFTLVRVTTHSGRMHQVRVHLAHLGCPLVGDPLYGGPPAFADAPGHFLHAERLVIPHPAPAPPDSGPLDLRAPLPADRANLLTRLGFVL